MRLVYCTALDELVSFRETPSRSMQVVDDKCGSPRVLMELQETHVQHQRVHMLVRVKRKYVPYVNGHAAYF
jgi:hypothetical protein